MTRLFDGLKLEAQIHLKERITVWRLLTEGNSDAHKFYGETISGRKLIVKYIRPDRRFPGVKRVLYDIQDRGVPIQKLYCAYLSVAGRYCFISEWLDGGNIDLERLNNDTEYMRYCARGSADALRKLHECRAEGIKPVTLEMDLDYALHNIERYHIEIAHLQQYLAYIEENKDKVRDAAVGYVHFDYNIQNVIETDGHFVLIDLETFRITEIWRDLIYAVCINFPRERKYWLWFLLEYFHGEIPDVFFRSMKIYVIIYMLMLAKSNFLREVWRNTGS